MSTQATSSAMMGSDGRDLLVGQKLAFGAASLTLGVCSFITLLGMEKAILAIVFGVLALKNGASRVPIRRGFARFGLAMGILQILFVFGALTLYWDEAMQLFDYLERFNAGK